VVFVKLIPASSHYIGIDLQNSIKLNSRRAQLVLLFGVVIVMCGNRDISN